MSSPKTLNFIEEWFIFLMQSDKFCHISLLFSSIWHSLKYLISRRLKANLSTTAKHKDIITIAEEWVNDILSTQRYL